MALTYVLFFKVLVRACVYETIAVVVLHLGDIAMGDETHKIDDFLVCTLTIQED